MPPLAHAPHAPNLYAGFLGSEGTRFYQQHTTDIHYVNYWPPDAEPKMRQKAVAVAQGLTFVSPEIRVNMGPLDMDGYPQWEVWQAAPGWCVRVRIVCKGPSLPGPFPPWPAGVLEIPVLAVVAGQWRLGFYVRWFHETVEWQVSANVEAAAMHPMEPLYYHEHEARQEGEHYDTLKIKKWGKQCRCNFLKFGTQWQVFRKAAHRGE